MKTLVFALSMVTLCGCFFPIVETVVGRIGDDGGAESDAGSSGGGTAGGGTSGGGQAGGAGGGSLSPVGGVTCSPDGFCWEGQVHGGTLHAVHGTSPSFVVAVGEGGVIATWNGGSPTYAQSPTRKALRGVWFSSSQLGWAIGDEGVMLEWNGSTWRAVSSGTTANLTAIHGAGDTVFVGGVDTLLQRRNGMWVPLTGVLAVTDSQTIVRSIAAESDNSVYLVAGRQFLHWNGQAWSNAATGSEGPERGVLYSVSVCAGTLFVSGSYSGEFHASWYRSGSNWNVAYADGARSVCLGADEFLSFGRSENHSNSDLNLVSRGQKQNVGTGVIPLAGFAAGPREVFLVGQGSLFVRWTGSLVGPVAVSTQRVFASSASNVLRLVGPDRLERRTPSGSWLQVVVPGQGPMVDVFGPTDSELWVLRQGALAHHLVGTTWTRLTLPADTVHVRGSGSSEVWFSGGEGVVSKWNGQELLTYPLPTQANTGPVYVGPSSSVWVPTWTRNGIGQTYRRTSSWDAVRGMSAWRIAGSGSEVFFAGVGIIRRWAQDRVVDVVEASPGAYGLGSSSTTLFVAADEYLSGERRGRLIRVPFAGGTITLDVGSREVITSMSVTPDGHVWLTVEGGGLLHRNP